MSEKRRALSLEEAVRKATSFPAGWFGIKDRGVLRPGAFADILIFDFDRIKPRATYLDPTQAPEGIECVLVNGRVVYQGMKHTGETSGKVLRHS